MKKTLFALFAVTICFVTATNAGDMPDIRIIVKTNKGDIEGTLYPSKTPVTVANFLNLANRGYYDGVTFHRVIPDFMIQGGDPTGTGRGGPGYTFEDECRPDLKHDKSGVFSMANTGRPVSNGSQFFITHVPTPWLDGKHTVFGEVTKGQDVVNSIKQGDKILKIEILDSAGCAFRGAKDADFTMGCRTEEIALATNLARVSPIVRTRSAFVKHLNSRGGSGEQFVWYFATVVRDLSDHHLVKPDVHGGGIAGVTGIVKIFGKFLARRETAVHADKLHQIDDGFAPVELLGIL